MSPPRMGWEKPYLEALIDNLHPQGDVLEVGFIFFVADRFQTYHPKHHTIIEPDPVIAAKAIQWAKRYPSVSVIQDTWEHALPELGIFNAIFFDDKREMVNAQELEAGNMAMQQGRKLVASVKAQFPEMMHTKYSDSDMDELFLQVGQDPKMAKFLGELLYYGQISSVQYEKALVKYGIEKVEYTPPKTFEPITDPVLACLKVCLKNHMRKGSRFSWSSSASISKFESPEFFDAIITNPHVDYEEKMMVVEMGKELLIGVVEKQT